MEFVTSIVIETKIRAPIELCFDLARDVDAHSESAAFSSERIVPPGRIEGLLDPGDHLGDQVTGQIEPPHHLRVLEVVAELHDGHGLPGDVTVVAPTADLVVGELGHLVGEGRHLGVKQRFVARITALDRPHRFDDEMVQGSFKWLRHFHEFEFYDGVTTMRDTLEWEPPLGIVGRLADRLFLRRHMHWFVSTKQNGLKRMAEDRVRTSMNKS